MKLTKENKIIIGGILALALIYLLYRYIVNLKAKKAAQAMANNVVNASPGSGTSNSYTGSTPTVVACTNNTVLAKGSKCDRVAWSQYEINRVATQLGISKLTQDGIFGSKTEAAFQKLLGKKTGTYAEVFNSVKSRLQSSSTPLQGSQINDPFKV